MIDPYVSIPATGLHPVFLVTEPPTVEPLTVAQGKLRAGLDWPDGDPRDQLMEEFIAAARAYVEADATIALLPQRRRLYLDAVPIVLELLVRPLTAATVSAILTTGTETPLDPAAYAVDLAGSRIAFANVAVEGQRSFQPWAIDLSLGYVDVAAIPAALLQAVGLLTAHYATAGRDLVAVGHMSDTVPYGYEELIAPWRPAVLA